MAHLLMYSTNHTVCRRSACPYAHALRVHLQHHVIGSSTACLQSPCTISVFQALAEALTTSKGMVGRQLLSCSDLDSAFTPGWVLTECAKIVRAVEATWAKASKLATDLADSFMGEVRKLGSQIQCAARPKDNAPHASRAALVSLRNVPTWNPVPLGRSVFDAVEDLANDIAAFATKLFNKMLEYANKAIDAISDLANQVMDEIRNAFSIGENGLCIAPSCPGASGHVNSGDEEDLAERFEDLDILASQLRAHAYRIPLTQRTLDSPTHSPTHRQRIALIEYPCYAHWRRPCSRRPPRLWPMWQAKTTVSVCFNVNEPKLDLSGLTAAIADFWLNNPAVQAPSRRLKLGFGAVLSASFDPTRPPQRPVEFRRPA